MSNLTKEAEIAVAKLLKAEVNQLYEQLGIRAKAIAVDINKSSSFEPQVTYNEAKMGFKEDVLIFGKRLYRRWNMEAYKLICGSDVEDQNDRKELVDSFDIGETAIAATLTTLLVTHLGIAPALASVIAVLTVKRFFNPAYEEFCRIWKDNIAQKE